MLSNPLIDALEATHYPTAGEPSYAAPMSAFAFSNFFLVKNAFKLPISRA